MTFEESIKESIHTLDLINKPYALYCNPEDAEQIKNRMPYTVMLVPLSHVEKGQTYLVNRKKCEMAYLDYELRMGDAGRIKSQAESGDKE